MLHDIKGKLARLLATENLIVEHKRVETASFNVHSRVLILPIWKIASSTVYDLLVSHEVGHALFTPDRDWMCEEKYREAPHQFVNIIEDARIEKLMKRKFAGLAKTFYRGYQELQDEDFFCLGDDDLSTYSFPDRVNLWFKVGNHTQVPIDRGQEMEIINEIAAAETFDQVLELSIKLKDFCQQKQEEKSYELPAPQQSESGGSETVEEETPSDSTPETTENRQEDAPETEEGEGTEEKEQSPQGGHSDEFETQTMDALEEKLKELAEMQGVESTYVEVPKVNSESVIAQNKDIRDVLATFWAAQQQQKNADREEYGLYPVDLFEKVDSEYNSYKKSANQEVNYLVKEFECRKTADAYSRSAVSRTGILDCTKLHTYKYNEDLFKKITVTPDGKNHGLIFVLDWSGSMERVLLDSVKQIMNLVWFCKKVGIPFDVYAFTNEWFHSRDGVLPPQKCELKENELHVSDDFAMLNFLSSKSTHFEDDMRNLFRLAFYFSSWRSGPDFSVPWRLNLSGTPLNEAVVSLHTILPEFKKSSGAQKVQCIVFTDGEAPPIPMNRVVKRSWEQEPYMGRGHVRPGSFLRNRKTGTVTRFDGQYQDFTKSLLDHLSETYPDLNVIGFRIVESRDAGAFIRRYISGYDEVEKVMKKWRKLRSFTLSNTGYLKYFALSSTELSKDTEFDVDDNATKTQIRNAFKKSLSSKKVNKKILSEFVELIA